MFWFPAHWLRNFRRGATPRPRPLTARPAVTELETRVVPALASDPLNHGTLALLQPTAAAASPGSAPQAPGATAIPGQADQLMQSIPASPLSIVSPQGDTFRDVKAASPNSAAADLFFAKAGGAAADCPAPVDPQLGVTAQDVPDAVANQEFTETVAVGNDTDPNITSDDLTATIDWGDGEVDGGVPVQGPDGDGNFTIDGTHTYGGDGQYPITVTVDDLANGLESSDTSTATVAPAPALSVTAQDVPDAVANQEFTETVAVGNDTDPNVTSGDLTATIDWGDGEVDGGVAVQGPDGYGNFTIDGTHTYGSDGQYTITVTVDDLANGLEAADASSATVAPAPALGVTAQDVNGAVANQEFTQTVAVVSDTDPNVTADDLTATIDWGDGQVDQGVAVQGPDDYGNFTVDGTHTYGSDGQYPITVTVDDTVNGLESSDTSTATVAPAPALGVTAQDVSDAVANQEFTRTVAVVSDTDPNVTSDNLTATIDWGDGQVDQGLAVQGRDDNGNFTVDGTHTYGTDGQYTITVTVDDLANGLESGDASTATVAPAPSLGVTAQDVTAQAGQPFTETVAQVSDPAATADQLTAAIDWGDGQVDQGVPVFQLDRNSYFTVNGSHTYADPVQYAVTVTVDDLANGLEATDTGTATVVGTPGGSLTVTAEPIAAIAGQRADLIVARANDPGAAVGQLTATVDWGDGQVDQDVAVQGPNANGDFAVEAVHTYAAPGQYPLQVTVTDTATGDQASDATTAVVQPATTSQLTVTPGTVLATAGQPFTGPVAVVSDPGATAGDLTATVSWGDGQADTGLPLVPAPGGGFAVQGTHTYTAAGPYNVTVQVADPSTGAEATASAVASVDAPVVGTTPPGTPGDVPTAPAQDIVAVPVPVLVRVPARHAHRPHHAPAHHNHPRRHG
jgi:hypothetical protein